jgi:anti-sigma regulatory factor (Ser/Thr protein kinase)
VPAVRNDPCVEFSAVMAPQPTAARAARQFVASVVTLLGLLSLQESAALVVSELVTNAVQHGEGSVVLRIRLSSSNRLHLEVSDTGTDEPIETRPGPDSEHGRGLWIVAHVSVAWGVDRLEGGGKTVWAELTN